MRRCVPGVLALLALVAPRPGFGQDRFAFQSELERLRRDLRLPALSAAVAESGTIVWVRHLGVTAAPGEPVRYPISSLTTPLTAVLAMRLVERRALALDTGPRDATVRQLLSHTPGGRFLYSVERLRGLQPILERAAGAPFRAALTAEVLDRAHLRHTAASARTTPSAGVESTAEDLARFAMALDRGSLLISASRLEMFRPVRGPTGQPLPPALGWFVQYVGGEEVRWYFGQEPSASSLLLMLPRRRLTLVVLARTDRLSAPFWPQMGDVRWSPAAAAFLTAWARVRIDLAESRRVMTRGLIAMHAGRPAEARGLVEQALGLAPALGDAADPALLAAFARSRDPRVRAAGRRIARRLLAIDADHPRTLLDLAVLDLEDGHPADARPLVERIINGGRATPEVLEAAQELRSHVERIP